MLRAELTQKILSRKRLKRLSWKRIAEEIGGGYDRPAMRVRVLRVLRALVARALR